jgi:hypothetical protein
MQNPFKKPHASLISVPEEPDIVNSVCKTKKRLLHLRKRTAAHEDGHHPTKTYHPNPHSILKHNTEITKPPFIIFLRSYFI